MAAARIEARRSATPGVTIATPRAYEVFGALCFAGRRARAFAGRRARAFAGLAELSGAAPGDRVLDVDCGTGCLTRAVAARIGPDAAVTGVDASPPVLAHAHGRKKRPGSAPCVYREGIAESLDFPDASFDTVVTSLMLHHLPQELRPAALREMRRVLRPGGRLLVVEFRPSKGWIGRRLVHGGLAHAMAHNRVDLLETLVGDAGFELSGRGDVRPWLTCVQGRRTRWRQGTRAARVRGWRTRSGTPAQPAPGGWSPRRR
ncbi:methyltransferase domain-containing protein [Streptomyces sp. NPDC052101]|uniref:class I SAM-dependent methyltransferase n=1 Tax=Streptomyces sp. NPDC052101 TaxID=3155763 RepID=UPI003415CD26